MALSPVRREWSMSAAHPHADPDPAAARLLALALAEAEPEPQAFAAGAIGRLIDTFGSWAGGSHATCVARLRGEVDDPEALCAWLKDRWLGTTGWRGDDERKAAEVGLQLFVDAGPRSLAEAPEWIPFLPRPGVYQHPTYGRIEITAERNAEFVRNHQNAVYQPALPVDAEHETKVSGALGWIGELRQNEDGSVDARVAWTDRGRAMLAGDRFRYVSPEYFDTWTDPATGEVHANVAIGAALCSRPFFKPGALRPLVASEGEVYVLDDDLVFCPFEPPGSAGTREESSVPTPHDQAQTAQPLGMTEEQALAFAELQENVRRLTEENARLAQAVEAARAHATALERESRRRRYTDEVLGRTGAGDGRRWYGEPERHVAMLESLADAFGEESEQVRQYIELNRAHAAQLAEAGLFREIGASGAPSPRAWDEIERRARALAGEGLTFAEAVERVAEADPQLYRRYLDGE